LREKSNPEVLAYLEAENDYTAAQMKHTEALQESLYQEMVARIKETDADVPEKLDDYFYYTRTEAGQEYPIYCRKRGRMEAEAALKSAIFEEILLDQNALAAGHNYCEIGVYVISPNHRWLAYSLDTNGSETYTLYIKDLTSGQNLPDQIPNTYYAVVWANDNRTLFYNTLDAAKRPYKLYRHTLGADPAGDALIYHETDESFFLSISKTRSKAYLVLNLNSATTSERHILKADDPTGSFRLVQPRQHPLEYDLDHHGDHFYIVANDQAKNFRLVVAPVDNPAKENWQELIPGQDKVKLERVSLFRDHLVLYKRENGLRAVQITNLASRETHQVEFPEPVYTIWPASNREFNTNLLRFHYTSLLTPESIFDYNMDDRTRELKKQEEVLGDYDPNDYRSERVFATAGDGRQIPISLVYKKGLVKDGNNPCLMSGYGAYETSHEPYFISRRLSLLERGFVCALAHARGGGEMGRPWYEEGKLLQKRNTFTDFIACAEHLIAAGYTGRQKLAIQGISAGGLLMGAVTTMRPELFKTVVAKVPFVDVINTMFDPSIPLTVNEYEEWGNPNHLEYYHYLKSYSPYDNVTARDYPNLLITAALNDPRVQYWEPAKWTARLRASKTDQNRLLLKTDLGAGHGGPSGRYSYLRQEAFIYAFILDILGVESPSDSDAHG